MTTIKKLTLIAILGLMACGNEADEVAGVYNDWQNMPVKAPICTGPLGCADGHVQTIIVKK